jgi:processive 1,2-diacylglycerol beta-glucosyltransferase
MRVLILTSSTGGGHDMRANAFAAWARLMPELKMETRLDWPLETSHSIYRFGVHLYNWIQQHAPFLHHVYFNFLELFPPCRSARGLLGAEKFRATLEEFRPDILLSMHGSLNHGYFEAARAFLGRDRVRCATYCGELFDGYGFSRNWVNPDTDLFIGPVAETCEAAIRRGMPREKTKVGGFLLRPEFYQCGQAKLQMGTCGSTSHRDEFTLLLSASSRGANNHIAFLEALKQIDLDVKVLCGKSATAHEQVARWSRQNKTPRVQIIPPDANMAALLQSVSAVVARPGVGTTCEAIIARCPLLFNCLGGAMPQERITVKFCRKHRLARTIQSPDELARIISIWKNDASEAEAIRQNMKAARPGADPREIVASVVALA